MCCAGKCLDSSADYSLSVARRPFSLGSGVVRWVGLDWKEDPLTTVHIFLFLFVYYNWTELLHCHFTDMRPSWGLVYLLHLPLLKGSFQVSAQRAPCPASQSLWCIVRRKCVFFGEGWPQELQMHYLSPQWPKCYSWPLPLNHLYLVLVLESQWYRHLFCFHHPCI